MKKTSLKLKLTALALAAVMLFSFSAAALAEPNAGSSSVPGDAAYAAAMGIIRQYIPGGQSITGVIDTIIKSYSDNGPSLADISAEIASMRAEIAERFAEIKAQMRTYVKEIEEKIVDQTRIAGAGIGLDKLLTAIEGTARQLNAIADDETLNANEKAVEMAFLIGNNSDWITEGKLYFEYRAFMHMLASPSFADREDRDLFHVVYHDCVPDSMFSGDAMDISMPYISRVMLLGTDAYSVIGQCLKAAQTVSTFTEEDEATLNADELYKYRAIKSLKSIVDTEIENMNASMFDLEIENSVMSHFAGYVTTNRLVFLNRGAAARALGANLVTALLSKVGESGAYERVWNIACDGTLSRNDLRTLADYVRATYPGKTLREYLTNIGFNMSPVVSGTIFVTGDPEVYNIEPFWDGGGIGFRRYCRFKAVSIDDAAVRIADHNAFLWCAGSNGSNYFLSHSNETVANFTNAN